MSRWDLCELHNSFPVLLSCQCLILCFFDFFFLPFQDAQILYHFSMFERMNITKMYRMLSLSLELQCRKEVGIRNPFGKSWDISKIATIHCDNQQEIILLSFYYLHQMLKWLLMKLSMRLDFPQLGVSGTWMWWQQSTTTTEFLSISFVLPVEIVYILFTEWTNELAIRFLLFA